MTRPTRSTPAAAAVAAAPPRGGLEGRAPDVHVRRAPPRPPAVYGTYWRFAAERQAVFFRRLEGASPPWSADAVLQRHKFTNAYRASDRVSQFLIGRVIYGGDPDPRETVFRILLFKLFNRIDTWQLLGEAVGEVTARGFDATRYDRALEAALAAGRRIYSAAYIMPSGAPVRRSPRSTPGGEPSAPPSAPPPPGATPWRKHRMHLALVGRMLRDGLPERLAAARSMRDTFALLRAYPTIGDFLAYQLVTDVNYSAVTTFSEAEFVMPGPGARDGLRKCFASFGDFAEADVIRLVADRQEEEFARSGLAFRTLWGRPLQLIDCQNLFCEVDKYARVVHPEAQARSGRTRIKQVFRAHVEPLRVWYPPKWGLNARIPDHARARDV